MESHLGDTLVVPGEDPRTVWERIVDALDHGERLLCVDACGLRPDDAETFLAEIRRCARAVARRGGDLTVVCPLSRVRSDLWQTGVPALSDRVIAQAVLG